MKNLLIRSTVIAAAAVVLQLGFEDAAEATEYFEAAYEVALASGRGGCSDVPWPADGAARRPP